MNVKCIFVQKIFIFLSLALSFSLAHLTDDAYMRDYSDVSTQRAITVTAIEP